MQQCCIAKECLFHLPQTVGGDAMRLKHFLVIMSGPS
uniref:Uncharacterized protein n=1 Tax=Anguilla anguilla TaxID=7936 RepID=A0A0E9VPE7_ANGAN